VRGDVVVIIDALRASVTIAAGLQVGAIRVKPVLTVAEAEAYLPDPSYCVAGERGGAKPSRFDFGNSPTEILSHRKEITNRVLVVTTSNGTRCVHAALPGAAEVLIGSTVNVSTLAGTAHALAQRHGADITLVAAGLQGKPAVEDTFAQRLLATRLVALGALPVSAIGPVCERQSLETFLQGRAAGVLTRLGYEQDLAFCAQIDLWDLVPVYDSDGFRNASIVALGEPKRG
jgi:2-phosphosulfolactate phosphatase